MSKKTINFFPPATFVKTHDGASEQAYVLVEHHPDVDSNSVVTSRIVQKFEDGSFETLNSLYKPIDLGRLLDKSVQDNADISTNTDGHKAEELV